MDAVYYAFLDDWLHPAQCFITDTSECAFYENAYSQEH